MSTFYGKRTHRISSSDILNIASGNIQVVSSGNDANGNFFINFYPTGGGCGVAPEPVIAIRLRDPIPLWSNLTYKLYISGVASCWNFNNGGTSNGINLANNIASFNTGLGDMFLKSQNCWELTRFNTGNSIVADACNNNYNNPFHVNYAVGPYREFFSYRRRSNLNDTAGPAIMLSCCSTGGLVSISNIFVTK